MTKKHFIALADAIRESYKDGDITENGLSAIAGFCYEMNPNFKRERWIDYINGACGKNGGKVKVLA